MLNITRPNREARLQVVTESLTTQELSLLKVNDSIDKRNLRLNNRKVQAEQGILGLDKAMREARRVER